MPSVSYVGQRPSVTRPRQEPEPYLRRCSSRDRGLGASCRLAPSWRMVRGRNRPRARTRQRPRARTTPRRLCYPVVIAMNVKPLDLTLEVAPRARFDVVEMRSQFAAEHEALAAYSNCLYWSSHTTAGFLDRSISARLSAQHVSTYVDAFRSLFPEGAGYEHD